MASDFVTKFPREMSLHVFDLIGNDSREITGGIKDLVKCREICKLWKACVEEDIIWKRMGERLCLKFSGQSYFQGIYNIIKNHKLAHEKDENAALQMGKWHQDGTIGEPCDEQARMWFEISARQGNQNAITRLSLICLKKMDLLRAKNTLIANQRHIAMKNDYNTLLHWKNLLETVSFDDPYQTIAAYEVGVAFYNGTFFEQNDQKAQYFLQIAASSGHLGANHLLNGTEDPFSAIHKT